MKLLALVCAFASATTAAFAGTWSVVTSNCFIDSSSTTGPFFSCYGNQVTNWTSEFGMDYSRSPTLFEWLSGSINGSFWAKPKWVTTVRYTATPGEFVDTTIMHTLKWKTRYMAYVSATGTAIGDIAISEFDSSVPIVGFIASAFDNAFDEDGTLTAPATPAYVSGPDVDEGFQLTWISGDIYEADVWHYETSNTYELSYDLTWNPGGGIMSTHIIQAAGFYRKQMLAWSADLNPI